MNTEAEIHAFLQRHLQSIQDNDLSAYHATTSEDLTLYEWWITPHRLDGLPFHDFMMTENARRGTIFGVQDSLELIHEHPESPSPPHSADNDFPRSRYDLSNLHIQHYGDCAIASYTLLTSTATSKGVQVIAHNESRVIVKFLGSWKVVHVHKSPAWPAPHTQPTQAG